MSAETSEKTAHDPFAPAFADIEKRLAEANPQVELKETALWRDQKSALTRIKILNATIDCLADLGYSKTSTQVVASKAKVSRGAMLHHYTTKAELMTAVVEYVYFRRLEDFYTEARKLSMEERLASGAGVEIYWRLMDTANYGAYLEVCMAARTDKDLADHLSTNMRKTNDFVRDVFPYILPEWEGGTDEEMQLALDVGLIMLDGLKLHAPLIKDKARRVAIRKFIFAAIDQLRPKAAQ